jgi:uncharacterized membrane protein HdeD (DUF308 family)
MATETSEVKKNTMAITSIILGGIAVLSIALLGAVGAAVIGVAAMVVGFIALKQVKERGEKGKGLATIGIILGFLPLFVLVLLMILGPVIAGVFEDITSSLSQ